MNRNQLIIVVLFVLYFVQINGQSGSRFGNLFFGVQAGINNNYLKPDGQNFYFPKLGFNIGLYGGYKITENISVSFEPVFSQFNSNNINPTLLYSEVSPLLYSETGLFKLKTMDLQINMIAFPLLGSFSFKLGPFTPRAFAGFSIDYILSANTLNEHEWQNELENTTEITNTFDPVEDRLKTNYYSAIAGASIAFNIGDLVVSPGIKANLGLSNFNNVNDKPNLYNHNLALFVNVGF